MTSYGYERIEDRTDGTGDDYPFYIVTGSIGPQFQPRTYESYVKAWQAARKICIAGTKDKVHPPFAPCIEGRHEAIR